MKNPQVNSFRHTGHRKILTADASPMEVIANLQADLKIRGLTILFSFSVIDKLGYDCTPLTQSGNYAAETYV
jgi:hypothetical protein